MKKKDPIEDVSIGKATELLLDREVPQDYLEERSKILKQKIEEKESESLSSVVVFRLSGEWYALNTDCFKEIKENQPIHSIPHRSSPSFLGITNVRGRLKFCISLHKLFGISSKAVKEMKHAASVQIEGLDWVFPLDEIKGVYSFSLTELENLPSRSKEGAVDYCKGLFIWDGHHVALIDEDVLLVQLKIAVQI
jgi:chemotaxis-related protein WspD